MQRSWNTIEELQLSERNMAPVQQELAQFNDVYKLFVNLHEELNPILEDSERAADDEWFEDIDERVCTFKRKTHNWLRVAEDNQHSSPSSRSKGSRSSGQSRSSGSSKSKGSKSSREKEIEERVKMAELLAEAEFLEQRQKVENEAEMLKVQQSLLKPKQEWQHTANTIQLKTFVMMYPLSNRRIYLLRSSRQQMVRTK